MQFGVVVGVVATSTKHAGAGEGAFGAAVAFKAQAGGKRSTASVDSGTSVLTSGW